MTKKDRAQFLWTLAVAAAIGIMALQSVFGARTGPSLVTEGDNTNRGLSSLAPAQPPGLPGSISKD